MLNAFSAAKAVVRILCALFLVSQLFLTLCDPVDQSLLGSFAIGILQARILKLVAIPSSRGSSQLRDRTQVSGFGGEFFTA